MKRVEKGPIIRCLALFLLQIFFISKAGAAFWVAEGASARALEIQSGHVFRGADDELRYFLKQVPGELSGQSLTIDLPMPDGSLAAYEIVESSIMQPELAAKFPQIRSFIVRGVDNPGSSGRVDISQKGFRGMVYTPYGRVFIDPVKGAANRYASRTGFSVSGDNHFQCSVGELTTSASRPVNSSPVTSSRIPGSMLGYRLAVSATPEYVAAVSSSAPSLNDAIAEINTAINRVNQIYERDLGIRLFLVSNNDLLIDINGEAGFDNEFPGALLDQNQAWIDSKLKSSSYDIGHIFSTGAGGVASLNSVCDPAFKAQGVSGLPDPTGDAFYVDFIAHEIGHQFGANHTFNGSTDSCFGEFDNRNPATAFEPGSGSTIMAYAGICGGENLQFNSEATFHAGTIVEINSFVSNTNTGGSCATTLALATPNSDPANANAGEDKTIPVGTAFVLTGSATDADGDLLSYQWDQFDAGTAPTTATTFNVDLGSNPLFRSYVPQSTPDRHFPVLENQLGLTNTVGEIIPQIARDLTFRLTVRDCKSGQTTDDVTVTVDANSGPFAIIDNLPLNFPATSSQTINWSTANTENAPVNCANVDIDLLTFSSDKSTYAVTNVASGVLNNGSYTIGLNQLDDASNAQARFRVSCSDNVFYDISDADLNITGALPFPTTGNTTAISPGGTCGDINVVGTPTGTGIGGGGTSDSGGGGATDWQVLLLLSVIVGGYCFRRFRFRVCIES